MDPIVKFTIGLFVFSLFLLFFKATKNLSTGYMNEYIIQNNDIEEREEVIMPQDIIWEINN